MGHKISKEQIDPGVKDHIMSFVGDVADLETEVNTDIISAVNSLMVDRVDNIENIGKLAEAIELYHPLITEYGLKQAINKNEIKYIKRGTKYFFSSDDLKKWIDEKKSNNVATYLNKSIKFV